VEGEETATEDEKQARKFCFFGRVFYAEGDGRLVVWVGRTKQSETDKGSGNETREM